MITAESLCDSLARIKVKGKAVDSKNIALYVYEGVRFEDWVRVCTFNLETFDFDEEGELKGNLLKYMWDDQEYFEKICPALSDVLKKAQDKTFEDHDEYIDHTEFGSYRCFDLSEECHGDWIKAILEKAPVDELVTFLVEIVFDLYSEMLSRALFFISALGRSERTSHPSGWSIDEVVNHLECDYLSYYVCGAPRLR